MAYREVRLLVDAKMAEEEVLEMQFDSKQHFEKETGFKVAALVGRWAEVDNTLEVDLSSQESFSVHVFQLVHNRVFIEKAEAYRYGDKVFVPDGFFG